MARKYHQLARTVVTGLEVAAEMFLHEEEIEELRIRALDEDEPWQRERQENDDSAQRERASQDRQVALDRGVDDEREARQHDADQPLRQDGARHCRPDERHRPRFRLRSRAGPMRADEREERKGMKESEADIERQDLRAEQNAPGTRQHRAHDEAGIGSAPPPP